MATASNLIQVMIDATRKAGRFDGFWERDLKPWDMAAGALMILEAGGRVTTADGEPYRSDSTTILAANPDIHPLVLERLRAA